MTISDDLSLIVHKPKNQTPELLPVLKVYICQRSEQPESWDGAVLVAAHDVGEASDLAHKHDPRWRSYTIVQMSEVYATGSPRILYNDEKR